MKTLIISLLSAVFMLAQYSHAADAEIYSHKKRGAIGGADVVAYYSLEKGDDAVRGDKNIAYEYKGATWYFSTEANRDLFKQDPEKYIPQYGGYCAYAVALGQTQSISPDYWHIIDGKLYLNYNFFADFSWRKDKPGYIAQADEQWPTVLGACEEKGKCKYAQR